MIKKTFYVLAALVLGVFLVFELIGISLFSMALPMSFYRRQLIAGDAAALNSHGLTEEQLEYVMRDTLNYLMGDGREYLDTVVTVDGEEMRVFLRDTGPEEDFDIQPRHMKDVKAIFTAIRVMMIAGVFFIPLCVLSMIKLRKGENFKRFAVIFLSALGAVIAAAFIAMAIDFENAFVFFHHLLFANEDWALLYDDMLIEMLPESLFMRLGFRIGGLFIGLVAALSLSVFFQGKIKAAFKGNRE
ncbi:MAG: DUF1461 domain-containing protein [Clostridiales bacterium]|jgi:integral membrane protein (TIGR01906 family)|nr:DUF1461 domain-containing protein [Clostridiales bacterium]